MEFCASAPEWKSIKCREFDEVCGWPLISKEKSINCSLCTQLCLTIAVIYPHWIWHRSVIKAIVKTRVIESRKIWARRTKKFQNCVYIFRSQFKNVLDGPVWFRDGDEPAFVRRQSSKPSESWNTLIKLQQFQRLFPLWRFHNRYRLV